MCRAIIFGLLLSIATNANAQGDNTRMGGNDGNYQSLAERFAKLEKKSDMFNLYLNYSASARTLEQGDGWETGFANKELRLEIKGNLTDKLFYRLRHRLNKANNAKGEDNFAKATDIMMVGYNFSDKLSLMAGKMTQIWGGYEYDENPMYVYEYSDFINHMDIYMAGAVLSYKPVPTQEIAIEVSNSYNGKLNDEYGDNLVVTDGKSFKNVEKAKAPLTYILNWNGSLFNDMLQTRWSCGLQTQARDTYSRMIILGQQLNLPKLQWYVDYLGTWDDLDRLGIATNEMYGDNIRAGKVNYNSFITKMRWQFAPQWKLMLKGTYETASMRKSDVAKNYRKSYGWVGSLEYYPDPTQDLRLFLAYVGKKINYNDACGLANQHYNRIELGFMYRIKCY